MAGSRGRSVAELGTGQPVPADRAVDGIDELLKVFVAYSVADWGSYSPTSGAVRRPHPRATGPAPRAQGQPTFKP
jgi:hypothetical protein